MAGSAESTSEGIVPANVGRESDEIRELVSTSTVGCEVPVIVQEQGPTMEVAEASSRFDNNKRVEEARRARVAKLEKLRRECASEEEYETARTQSIRTQLDVTAFKTAAARTELDSSSSSSCAPDCLSEELESIREDNRRHFQHLVDTQSPPVQRRWFDSRLYSQGTFFNDYEGRLKAGKKLGGGGQASIHEAIIDGEVSNECVLKVFGIEWLLANLQQLWMEGFSNSSLCFARQEFGLCHVKHGTLLKDGRFVFLLERYAGDLCKCIDIEIVKDRTHDKPPFSHHIGMQVLSNIAFGMSTLHEHGILHKDLKATNILLRGKIPNAYFAVADFDSPKGVVVIGFWRALEVLLALKNKILHTSEQVWTKKVDVYNYAMTCYEVVTGCIPFEDCAIDEGVDGILKGERPPLPDYVDPKLQDLIKRCWHSEPEMRPDFLEIAKEFDDMRLTS